MGRALRKAKAAPSRAKPKSRKQKKAEPEAIGLGKESLAIVLAVLGIFIAASLYSFLTEGSIDFRGYGDGPETNLMGPVGAIVAELLFSLLGWCSFVTVIWSLLLSRTVWVGGWPSGDGSIFKLLMAVFGSALMAASCATAASVTIGYQGGGIIGSTIAFTLIDYINQAGTLLISIAAFFLSLSISTGIAAKKVFASGQALGRGVSIILADTWFVVSRTSQAFANFVLGVLHSLGQSLFFVFRGVPVVSKFIIKVLNIISQLRLPRRQKQINTTLALPEKPFVLGDKKQPTQTTFREVKISRRGQEKEDKKKDRNKKNRLGKNRGGNTPKENKPERQRTYEDYLVPSSELLTSAEIDNDAGPDDNALLVNGNRLEEALLNFRIGGKVIEVQPGPIVTLYEFEPAPGVKVQRVITLADDLALALKVASVRVYAPVPGKGTIGIEVPNADREIVRLRDLLESEEFQQSPYSLPLALGKNTFGDPAITDLARMPHLLIAGATGSGKSVCINSVILSLLYRHSPEDLRLILIDPKMLELSIYEDIPHLKAPVVTSPKRARGVLWWAVEEMDRRYKLMKDLGVRGISSYNAAVSDDPVEGEIEENVVELDEGDVVSTSAEIDITIDRKREPIIESAKGIIQGEKLPRIVIVIDELADLMLTVGREIEELLTRLAQKARAAGIHLILATQRPSVNVITGLIKANFPARVSFKVASRIDSRTILDCSGSEKLLGHGDMLFLAPTTGKIKRLHSPFVSDNEVIDVVSWVRSQGAPDYDKSIEKMIERMEESEKTTSIMGREEEYDPLYDQAVALVVEKGQASTSMVQRAFRIGYNRAARILETMESEGIVGPADGSRPREILVPGGEI